jgi:predicted Zn-dependent protease
MSGTSLAKAVIINLDKNNKRVECMFNPAEYTFTKRNTWKQGRTSGQNMPRPTFESGKPATLKMKLFFDTYAAGKDVRKEYTDAIWELMMVDPELKDAKSEKSRPPTVRFQWGETWAFDAVIINIRQQFTLFLNTGTPVRATLNVTFQQCKDTRQLRPQNPTSGGIGGERVWTVNAGDTLAWIAFKSYGDATRWRPIAQANKLTRVRQLQPGTVLVIPND